MVKLNQIFGVSMGMTSAILKIANMENIRWPLAVRQATCIKNRVPTSTHESRKLFEMVNIMIPKLGHMQYIDSKLCVYPLMSVIKSCQINRRYICHTDNESTLLVPYESANRVFHCGCTDAQECLDEATACMSEVCDPGLTARL